MKNTKVSEVVEINDSNAVTLAAKGSADAFSYLYERNVSKIYSYVFYRIGSAQDAEDITARVFHRAFGHMNSYVEKGVPFSAWLYRIAHNLIANWHRDNFRRHEVSLEDQLDLPHKGDLPERMIERNQETEMLLKAIRKLSPDRQQLILLKYLDDMSNAEIAVIMKKTEGAIKSLYHRSLISLREELEKINVNDTGEG